MAKVSKKPNRKGLPPSIEEASENLTNKPVSQTSGVKKDLNFKVDEEFKRRYKTYASSKGKSMVDVLTESFELYIKQNP